MSVQQTPLPTEVHKQDVCICCVFIDSLHLCFILQRTNIAQYCTAIQQSNNQHHKKLEFLKQH